MTQQDIHIPVLAGRLGSWRISLDRQAYTLPDLANHYDAIAPGWGRKIARLGVPQAYEAELRRIVSPIDRRAPLNVLDCGIGTGALSLALSRMAQQPLEMEGLDLSERMVGQACEILTAEGVSARVRQGDACALPYASERFDLVMAAHLLEHLPDPAAALAEMVRVTRPGGQMILFVTPRSLWGVYIHLLWRTRMFAASEIMETLSEIGLTHILCRPASSRGLSTVIAARKPL